MSTRLSPFLPSLVMWVGLKIESIDKAKWRESKLILMIEKASDKYGPILLTTEYATHESWVKDSLHSFPLSSCDLGWNSNQSIYANLWHSRSSSMYTKSSERKTNFLSPIGGPNHLQNTHDRNSNKRSWIRMRRSENLKDSRSRSMYTESSERKNELFWSNRRSQPSAEHPWP